MFKTLLETDQDLTRNSYYAATAPRTQRFAALQDDGDADVAIVGGGLAGLSAALELSARGYSVTLLEAREVGWGASGRNGGQVIAGLASDISVIEEQLGTAVARRVWDMTVEAVNLVHERRARHAIDCEWRSGYLTLALNARKARTLRAWQEDMLQRYDFQSRWIEPKDMPRWIASPRFHSGVYDDFNGHLHPLKYTQGLAAAAAQAGVRLHEDTAVTALETQADGALTTLRTVTRAAGQGDVRGSVRARHVLLAGNVYLQEIARALEARIMPVGTYIIASEPMDPALADSLIPSGAAVCDTNFVLDYFRPMQDHRMLYGGRVSYSTATPMNLAESMRRRMLLSFPQLKDVKAQYAWGGFVDISMNRAPDFGRLSQRTGQQEHANIFYLQGFSGHGLALTGLAGKLVAEAIAGQAERFDIFARIQHRPFPGGRWLRTPALVLGMAYYRIKDLL
ncbi:NAD(P)/FAD-dependent oxidoreductase [Hylemonella gracilis]|uniref:Oxidoreductase n=1 Tax=Hylemonella gracilis ATCC 19624 TaxID=887062 RepID=F3KW64_9BURK|nr:FAD-binding oxidoreductase [Hylemonella gracilis]EGI75985.1 oxidoreductase [Hylemonella gracilis ATCC 19624]